MTTADTDILHARYIEATARLADVALRPMTRENAEEARRLHALVGELLVALRSSPVA